MPRFFVKREDIDTSAGEIVITDGARHISRSLRMAVGDEVTVCDGEGTEYTARLAEIRDERVLCRIIESHKGKSELPVSVTLFMGYPKSDKLEFVIQKAVELGASEIVPFISSRCVKRPSEERSQKREDRYQKIADEAAAQSGRARLARVGGVVSFSQMLDTLSDFDLAVFCYEGEGGASLKQILESARDALKIAVIVGSEGGFSEREAEEASRVCRVATLGNRILRCETAPLYALSAISYFYEL